MKIFEKKRGRKIMKYKMTEKGFSSNFEYGTLNISSESEYGFHPFQLLVSSIAGCSGGVLRQVMKKMRLDVDHIEIEAKVTRSGGQVKIVKKWNRHMSYMAVH
jgi:uncharacterized OsmC-like protein